ncbi:MAG: peptidylprolyl isomerase [Longimicrobiales bacterium]|jgi:peptidyl-prolyl cis-trans isomerase SurA
MMKRSILIGVGLMLAPGALQAQLEDLDVVDRLVAIVGDSAIVQTQVQEEIQRMQLGGAPVPAPGTAEYDALFQQVLNRFVDRLLVLQAAARDSLLRVDDETINERVTEQITQLTSQFGGQAQLQEALSAEALTLAEYREILRNDQRVRQIEQLFYQSRLRDAPPAEVTEDELLERFQEARGQLQQRPKLMTIRQVVIQPSATDAAVDSARARAEGLLERITAGEDFAELAREFSGDPGSAALGGDLGWFRRGRMVREFEEAAFSLADGQVSDVVQSDFGFHIIKVERMRPGERNARHILIVPEKTGEDLSTAREVAMQIRQQAEAGASMRELYDEYSDPAAPDSITFAFEQLSELPPAYSLLRTASAGEFVGPLEYEVGPGEARLAVISVTEVREAGAYTFEDLRGQLAAQLQQERQIERIIEELRALTYIDIRM